MNNVSSQQFEMAGSKVLVTGPNGFVGTQLCRELLRRGSFVLEARRSGGRQPAGKEVFRNGGREQTSHTSTVEVGDIGPNTNWLPALAGIDTIVHLAARVHIMEDTAANPLAECRIVNVEGTRRLAESAALAGVKRLIFLSSIKVNGESINSAQTRHGMGEMPFTEKDEPHPEDSYALSKYEAEQALRAIERRTGMEIVIIRPPLIYGPGVKANLLKLVHAIERGIFLPFGRLMNKRALLSLSNLVDLICCCLVHPSAAGETFLASDGEDVSTPELVRRIGRALGKPARLVPVPEWMLMAGGALAGKSNQVKRLCSSLQVDSSKVRRMLGWNPPCSMAEELALIAAWRASKR